MKTKIIHKIILPAFRTSIIVLLISFTNYSCQKESLPNKDINETDSTLTDFDGNVYKKIKIGNQIWMAENLKVGHYPDGTEIPIITEDTIWADLINNFTAEACCYYNNDVTKEYGVLYNYAAAEKACPTGWHLPSDKEWNELEDFIHHKDSTKFLAQQLKDTIGWRKNLNGTNDYGFSAIPGGFRHGRLGQFQTEEMSANWWSSTEDEDNDIKVWYRSIYFIDNDLLRESRCKSYGHSVRCIKD